MEYNLDHVMKYNLDHVMKYAVLLNIPWAAMPLRFLTETK